MGAAIMCKGHGAGVVCDSDHKSWHAKGQSGTQSEKNTSTGAGCLYFFHCTHSVGVIHVRAPIILGPPGPFLK